MLCKEPPSAYMRAPFDRTHFLSLLRHAEQILGLPVDSILVRYLDQYSLCTMKFYEKGKRDDAIEIRFDTEEASIVCYASPGCGCENVHICPDSFQFTEECIHFLNSEFESDSLSWKMQDKVLTLKCQENLFYFAYQKGRE